MLIVILLLPFITSWGLVEASGLDLPSYISRCSLSDPKLSECLKKTANQIIPVIIKGDVFYSIPPMSPISYSEAPFYATALTYVLYNTHCDDFSKLVITDMFVDLKNHNFGFVGNMDIVELTTENYTVTNGKMLDIRACGHGKTNTTFVGTIIKYAARLRFYRKGGDVYLDYFDSSVDLSCKHAYFYFENIESTEECDVNAYLNENSQEFYTQVKPALSSYCNAFVNFILKSIANAVPFNKMFLP